MEAQPDGRALFFAFPDGAYDYVCAECTALCCRGHGFGGNLRREMGTLLSLYPSLAAAVGSRRGDVVDIRTPPAGCLFLEADRRCGIEARHGRGLKPGICGLFPFNSFTRVGSVVAVSPHFLCPLTLRVPARIGSAAGTHALLETAVRDSGLLDEGFLASHPSAILHPTESQASTLRREAAFRDRCAESLGRRSFRETLRHAAADAGALDRAVARASALVTLPVRREAPRDGFDDVLLALAPPTRLSLLALPGEAVLTVLSLAEGVARHVLSLSSAPPGLQTVHSAIHGVLPALRLLALGDRPLALHEAASGTPPLGREVGAAVHAAVREAAAGTPAVFALERAIDPRMSPSNRWIVLGHLGRHMAAGVVPDVRRPDARVRTPARS